MMIMCARMGGRESVVAKSRKWTHADAGSDAGHAGAPVDEHVPAVRPAPDGGGRAGGAPLLVDLGDERDGRERGLGMVSEGSRRETVTLTLEGDITPGEADKNLARRRHCKG